MYVQKAARIFPTTVEDDIGEKRMCVVVFDWRLRLCETGLDETVQKCYRK